MMIHDYFLLHSNVLWISVSLTLCLLISLISCVCGCRKKVPKNELLGLDGLVKLKNPDENVNFSSVATTYSQLNSSTTNHQTAEDLIGESHNSSKRGSSSVATATRSLPDLPVDSGEAGEKLWEPIETNVDTNSDLYATVEDPGRKKRNLAGGRAVESGYTPSQTDDSLSPYARLKDEHPYAQVGINGAPGPSTMQNPLLNSPLSSGRADSEVDTDSCLKRSTPDGSTDHIPEEIPAASAIAGSVPANQDLPYMTPPIVTTQQQLHFSGDSADSSKGYTSISVREPLSRILADRRRRGSNNSGIQDSSNGAQSNDSGGGTASVDPHYATVSDDSDEMYAAIEERHMSLSMMTSRRASDSGVNGGGGGGEYTSGSETYAQIAPLPTESSATDCPPPPSRHPPNLSLVLHHQDSVSTCSSSDSPRRERRAANSPLPQVPLPTLDDLYAKVVKKGRSPSSPESAENVRPVLRAQDVDDGQTSLPGYETVISSSTTADLASYAPSSKSATSTSSRSNSLISQTGATVSSLSRHSSSATDPNYEELKCGPEPDYASLSRPSVVGPGYSTAVRRHHLDSRPLQENEGLGVYEDSPSGSLVDPNYERVGSHSGAGEPPYERLNNTNPELTDYEVVCNLPDQRTGSLSDLYAKVDKSEKRH